jgi:hypothetical protein
MDRRHQVFVSSTYADLKEERQEVMQALLELDCIPSGMELFPAADEDQWTLIRKVIDDCDYYLVIVAGRYGSLGQSGQSFTEMEYRYAVERGKPVIGFLHSDPGVIKANRSETSADGRASLESFRTLVQEKMCRFWDSPKDLGSKVSRSLVKLIREHPAVGWVRGDQLAGEAATGEILKLRRRIDELERDLMELRVRAPEGTGELAQGQDTIGLSFSFAASDPDRKEGNFFQLPKHTWHSDTETVTWDELFAALSPLMLDEISEPILEKEVSAVVHRRVMSNPSAQFRKAYKGLNLSAFTVNSEDFQTIKIQLRALGLIAKSSKSHSIKDTLTYWTLTPYGDTVMTRLRAIPRLKAAPSPR